jgi:hypothetical protein
VKTIATFNALHLGDNLVHLHFLRKLAQQYPDIHFTHGAPDQHLAQLYPIWQDLPNLTVQSIALTGQGAINAWRGAGGWFYQQPDQNEFTKIHVRWFDHLAKEMGLESPIREPRDLLFDYPALSKSETGDRKPETGEAEFDFLVINSPPQSGQWSGHDPCKWQHMISHLSVKRTICTSPQPFYLCTRDFNMDVTAIGRLSQRVKCIIGCVTGPMWPCLNIWNADTVKLRIHLLDHERVDYLPDRTVHTNSLSLVPELLKERGLL